MAYFQKVPAKNKQGYKWKCTEEGPRNPATGKRTQITRRADTKKEAAFKVEEALKEIRIYNGQAYNKDILFKDYLPDWLATYKKNAVKENTYKLHERNVQKKILPLIGHMKIKDLTPTHYQKIINKLADQENSKRTVEIIHITLSNAMNKAVSLEMLSKNPCSGVTIPNKAINQIKEDEDLEYLSKDEVIRFLDAALKENWNYFILFKTLIDTGLRKGEALALQVLDLDFTENKIKVYKTLNYDVLDIDKMFGPPKTETSYRKILIDESLAALLTRHIIKQKEIKLKLADRYHRETTLVFERGNGNGLPYSKSTLHRAFNRICRKAGITKHITIHGLRHTHAVLLLESGASLKDVQERLGHKSIQTTADVYAHVSKKLEEKSVDGYSNYMDYPQLNMK
ncbi:tyrosine-type recombinase/integrase [Peribacillus frigoritolerans]|uniref:tyrosine-type recombinase/integrase n=1 Tax=Peribacillus frigoritolerans TaxID=450367 RepID=UPI00203FB58C|nr:site-specific integrase [Peribacillus frigoritolerans]MCM3168990.1 site-specific integrase [Peribacillus frigoritolerans]